MVIALLPARFLARRIGDAARARHFNVLFSSTLVCGWLFLFGAELAPGFCLFRGLTGHACPFCGVTHAVAAALRGHLRESWGLHFAGPVVAVVLAAQIPLRALALWGHAVPRTSSWLRAERIGNWSVIATCVGNLLVRSQ